MLVSRDCPPPRQAAAGARVHGGRCRRLICRRQKINKARLVQRVKKEVTKRHLFASLHACNTVPGLGTLCRNKITSGNPAGYSRCRRLLDRGHDTEYLPYCCADSVTPRATAVARKKSNHKLRRHQHKACAPPPLSPQLSLPSCSSI